MSNIPSGKNTEKHHEIALINRLRGSLTLHMHAFYSRKLKKSAQQLVTIGLGIFLMPNILVKR